MISYINYFKNWLNENQGVAAVIIFILTIVLGWISGLFKFLIKHIYKTLFKKKSSLKTSISYNIPKETLRIVPQPRGLRWSRGKIKRGNREIDIIILSGSFYVTNLTNGTIHLASTYSKKPKSEETFPMIKEPPPRAHYWGHDYPILSKRMTEMHASYVIDSSLGKDGKNIFGQIVIVDQLGNEHLIKAIFKPALTNIPSVTYFQRVISWLKNIPLP